MAERKSAASETNARDRNVSIELLIGLATAPVLVALVGGKVLADAATNLGQFSEELFRGDRLPFLKFPTSHSPTSTPDVE